MASGGMGVANAPPACAVTVAKIAVSVPGSIGLLRKGRRAGVAAKRRSHRQRDENQQGQGAERKAGAQGLPARLRVIDGHRVSFWLG